jgi:hypothetical protein
MKTLVLTLALVSSSAFAQSTGSKKAGPVPMKKETTIQKPEMKTKEFNALDKKPEDCDTKAKKPVEITPESISLSGNAGCSLDDAHP